MTRSDIYIELTNGDRKYLKPSQVDIMNYDNNHGYDVWAMVDGDMELLFASKEERDEFMDDNGLIPESWPGTWEYDIECDIHRGTYDTIGGYYDKKHRPSHLEHRARVADPLRYPLCVKGIKQ